MQLLLLSTVKYVLNMRPYTLLGELPEKFTAHWRPSGSISAFAKHILSGRCRLEVSGLPSNKDLRAPLVELVEIFERSKDEIEAPVLSDSLKQQVRCEDLLEELINGEARLFGTKVPFLKVEKDFIDTDEDDYGYAYICETSLVLLIDFDQSANQPVISNDPWRRSMEI